MLPVMVEGLGCYWEHICGTLWELDENNKNPKIQHPPAPPQFIYFSFIQMGVNCNENKVP
jgi:hypothetical protein